MGPWGHWVGKGFHSRRAGEAYGFNWLHPIEIFPKRQDLERAAPKIQAGMDHCLKRIHVCAVTAATGEGVDWFYFELLPGIEKEDISPH